LKEEEEDEDKTRTRKGMRIVMREGFTHNLVPVEYNQRNNQHHHHLLLLFPAPL
jgi:hypothetical protein